MPRTLEQRLKRLTESGQANLLAGGLKGIEKESLRVTPEGYIAQTPHPQALGSALTHPYITTDYSEALLEFRTPACADLEDTLSFLTHIHQFVYANIDQELLWAASMPCALQGEGSIPIAHYGRSNVGMMKHVYRRGLAYRYGRAMQAIAGVHFNYSLPLSFWPAFQELEGDRGEGQAFISGCYLAMIRNFQRLSWLIPYLFGSSPAVCGSFVDLRIKEFEEFDGGTRYQPYATSLRMSDIGYKNETQASLEIFYNDLESYMESLSHAVNTPHPKYQAIGVSVDGEYRQLNANWLQIENEYYSFIRPKQIARSGEKPLLALKRRGVAYVEVRALDIGCFDPLGVNAVQLRFAEAFLIVCLLLESPPVDASEWAEIQRNQEAVATGGRDPELKLHRKGREVFLQDWALRICDQLHEICTLLDEAGDGGAYIEALAVQRERLLNPEMLPSARVLAEMRARSRSFFRFALDMSSGYRSYFLNQTLAQERTIYFGKLAQESIEKQRMLEVQDTVTFSDYLERYFAQR